MTSFALKDSLDEVCAQGLYRVRDISDGPQAIELALGGRKLLNFSSNDYLGLANHPEVVAAFHKGAEQYGVGAGSAHLICGHSRLHHELEEALAEFTGRPRALLFSTGYMANLGVITALTGAGDHVFEDRLNHASLLDGGLLSEARFRRYTHADAQALEFKLVKAIAGRKLVVSDGVFSMDGDLAPLPELTEVCQRHDAWLMVDDAHGLGVLGERGGGALEHYGLSETEVPVLVGTLGKAFGTFGAFVAGSDELIETLIQKARSYIYTTALPPAVAAATLAALPLVRAGHERREQLRSHVQRFREGAESLGLQLLPSDTPVPVQAVILGEADAALAMSEQLLARGIRVGAIRPPTVPEGSARLRVSFSASHETGHIDRLLETFSEVCARLPR